MKTVDITVNHAIGFPVQDFPFEFALSVFKMHAWDIRRPHCFFDFRLDDIPESVRERVSRLSGNLDWIVDFCRGEVPLAAGQDLQHKLGTVELEALEFQARSVFDHCRIEEIKVSAPGIPLGDTVSKREVHPVIG